MNILKENKGDFNELNAFASWEIEENGETYNIEVSKSFDEDTSHDFYTKKFEMKISSDNKVLYNYNSFEDSEGYSDITCEQNLEISDEFLKKLNSTINDFNFPSERKVLAEKIDKEYFKESKKELDPFAPYSDNKKIAVINMEYLKEEATGYALIKNIDSFDKFTKDEFKEKIGEDTKEFIDKKINLLYPEDYSELRREFLDKFGKELGIEIDNNVDYGVIKEYSTVYEENEILYNRLAEKQIDMKLSELALDVVAKLEDIKEFSKENVIKTFENEIDNYQRSPKFSEIVKEEYQELYNTIRDYKEELLKVGAVDNLKIDNEELEKFTFGFYKFDNNEIKEFERRYNLKHDIKDIEEHTKNNYNIHFIEKEVNVQTPEEYFKDGKEVKKSEIEKDL